VTKPELNKKGQVVVDAEIVRDDMYSAQREELHMTLKACLDKNEPLSVHEKAVLIPDEIYVVLQKIKHSNHFSRKERNALTEAGFQVDNLYPDL